MNSDTIANARLISTNSDTTWLPHKDKSYHTIELMKKSELIRCQCQLMAIFAFHTSFVDTMNNEFGQCNRDSFDLN